MDDFKIWFYVIVAIIYVISRVLKKGKGPSQESPQEMNEPRTSRAGTSEPKDRPMTFEELLQEISETKASIPKPVPVVQPKPRPVPAYVDYDDDLKDETDTETYKSYEKAKKEAFERPSLQDTIKLGVDTSKLGVDTSTLSDRFTEFSIKKKGTLLKSYAKELRTKKGFKRAIVLNEILNRRF